MKITEKALRESVRQLIQKTEGRKTEGLSSGFGTSFIRAFGDFCGLGYDWKTNQYFLNINAGGENNNIVSCVYLTGYIRPTDSGASLYLVLASSIEKTGFVIV